MNSEYRESARFDHEAIILIENPYGAYYHGKMINYSKTGMYFESNLPFKSGQTIIFGIENTPYESCPGVYRAVVKWCRKLPDFASVYYYGVGVEYIQPARKSSTTKMVRARQALMKNASSPEPVLKTRINPPPSKTIVGRQSSTNRGYHLQPAGDFRKYERKTISKTICFSTGNGVSQGIITDISPGGMFLEVSDRYRVGQTLHLSIPLVRKNKEIKVVGEIVRTSRKGLGIKFKGLLQKQNKP